VYWTLRYVLLECRYRKTSLPSPRVLPWNFPRPRGNYRGYRGITAFPVTVYSSTWSSADVSDLYYCGCTAITYSNQSMSFAIRARLTTGLTPNRNLVLQGPQTGEIGLVLRATAPTGNFQQKRSKFSRNTARSRPSATRLSRLHHRGLWLHRASAFNLWRSMCAVPTVIYGQNVQRGANGRLKTAGLDDEGPLQDVYYALNHSFPTWG